MSVFADSAFQDLARLANHLNVEIAESWTAEKALREIAAKVASDAGDEDIAAFQERCVEAQAEILVVCFLQRM